MEIINSIYKKYFEKLPEINWMKYFCEYHKYIVKKIFFKNLKTYNKFFLNIKKKI